MKTTKRALRALTACLLVLCLLSAQLTVIAAEPEEDKLSYVAFGDSTTNGYGFDDYYRWNEEGNIYANNYGLLTNAEKAYPMLLANAYDAELTQLGMSAMRAEDLYGILDPEGYEASYIPGGDNYYNRVFKDNGINSNGETGEQLFKRKYNLVFGVTDGSQEKLSEVYNEAVKNADVISIDIGTNNFGCYISFRLGGLLGMFDVKDDDVITEAMQAEIDADPLLKAQMAKLECSMATLDFIAELATTAGYDADTIVNDVTSAIRYSYAGFALNFKALFNYIRSINPSAEIIVTGLASTLDGAVLDLSVMDCSLGSYPLGDRWNDMLTDAEIYMQYVIMGDSNSEFVDINKVESFYDELKACKIGEDTYDTSTLSSDYYCRLVQNLVFNSVNDALNGYGIPSLSLKAMTAAFRDIEANGEASVYYPMLGDAYGQFESALEMFVESANLEKLDMVGLVSHMDTVGELLNSGDGDILSVMQENKDETWAQSLLYIYVRFLLADGVTIHPNAAGHEGIAESIMNSEEVSFKRASSDPTVSVDIYSYDLNNRFFKRTMYVATITVKAGSSEISKVEYSASGYRWIPGTVYMSLSEITQLYIRVTDAAGVVTNWLYADGTVTAV